ncbi:response regulator [Aspergillus undulatus]|uniref:response regulator n=1 Tax=Aspergillus undulatus TaxID=1810928 RepID=UPI003CCD09BE
MHVLYVDDNDAWRTIHAIQYLHKAGCTVAVAAHGQQALDYLRGPPATCPRPDLMLMDIAMPIMGGLEAAQIIRTQAPFSIDPAICSTPIVGMCSTGLRADHARFIAQGMDDILVKPWTVHDVRRLIAWWSRRQLLPRIGEGTVPRTAVAPIWRKRSRV